MYITLFINKVSVVAVCLQDGATKILHSHMRSASESTSDVLAPRNATSPPAGQQRSRPPSRSVDLLV